MLPGQRRFLRGQKSFNRSRDDAATWGLNFALPVLLLLLLLQGNRLPGCWLRLVVVTSSIVTSHSPLLLLLLQISPGCQVRGHVDDVGLGAAAAEAGRGRLLPGPLRQGARLVQVVDSVV
jgi:hypothetical protein